MAADTVYRTLPGDCFRDPFTGIVRVVTAIFRAEDIHRFVDGNCYRQRFVERCALHMGHRTKPMKAMS